MKSDDDPDALVLDGAAEDGGGVRFSLRGLVDLFKTAVQEGAAQALAGMNLQPEEGIEMSEQVAPEAVSEEETPVQEATPETPEEEVPAVEQVSKSDTVADALSPEVRAQLVALEKANQSLMQRVEKAEQTASQERDLRVGREWLEKAAALPVVPVKADELAAKLHELSKSDAEAAEYFLGLLKSMGEMLKDGKVFEEVGTRTEGPETEPTILEKAEKLIDEGKAADLSEAISLLPPDEQRAYLRERRKEIRDA